MLKNIVVNLPLDASRNAVTDFAFSVAAAFDAHLTGIAFLYEPLIPTMVEGYGIPADVIESLRVENDKAARAAMDQFDEAARRSALSAEARMLDGRVASAPNVFARIARDSTCRSSPSLNPTSPHSIGSSSRRRCSTPAVPCSSSPTFNALALSSTASWCVGTEAAPPPAPSPTRCRSSSGPRRPKS